MVKRKAVPQSIHDKVPSFWSRRKSLVGHAIACLFGLNGKAKRHAIACPTRGKRASLTRPQLSRCSEKCRDRDGSPRLELTGLLMPRAFRNVATWVLVDMAPLDEGQ